MTNPRETVPEGQIYMPVPCCCDNAVSLALTVEQHPLHDTPLYTWLMYTGPWLLHTSALCAVKCLSLKTTVFHHDHGATSSSHKQSIRVVSLRLDALQRKQLLVKRREFDVRILLLEPAEDAAVTRTEHVQKRDLLEEPHQHLVLFNVVLAELELQGRLDALAQFTYDNRVLDPGSC